MKGGYNFIIKTNMIEMQGKNREERKAGVKNERENLGVGRSR